MTGGQMEAEVQRLSALLDKGLEALREQGQQLAQAESDYRKQKSVAWLEVREVLVKASVAEKEAWVNSRTADLRYARDLADTMRQAALEAVRSRRTQLSACQSLLAANTEESRWGRTGPTAA